MRPIAQIISFAALFLVVLAPVLFLAGSIGLPWTKHLLLIATVVWFVATPLWMGRKPAAAQDAQAAG